MSVPTPHQTLASLVKVSRGEIWHSTPQSDPWKRVGDLAADLVWQNSASREAAE